MVKVLNPVFMATLGMLSLCHCNLEVGNPEARMPGGSSSFQTLSFDLSAGKTCETTQATCIGVPVVFSDGQKSEMTYEMTEVNFQLSGIEFKPLGGESAQAQIDLLNGTLLTLSESRESAAVTDIAVRFMASDKTHAPTFSLAGNFVTVIGGERLVLPLKITFEDEILAQTGVSAGSDLIEGIVFNANMWFDFMDAKDAGRYILQGLTSGACRDNGTRSCIQYRENLARQISEKISKSISVKTKPGQKSRESRNKISP